MAIRDFWCFEGLPNPGSQYYSTLLTTAPTAFMRNDWVYNGYNCTVDTSSLAGWLTLGSAAFQAYNNGYLYWWAGYGGVGVPYGNVSNFSTPQSYIGFRVQYSSSVNAITNLLYMVNAAGTGQILVPASAVVKGNQSYVEVLIDRQNSVFTVWVDGVQFSSTSFNFTNFANGGAVSLYFGSYSSVYNASSANGGDGYFRIRDVYFLDNTQDATQCSRLGPIDIRLQPLASATAPNWISSDSSTPLADLSTVLGTTAATQTLPTIQSPGSRDPLTLQLANTSLVANEPIIGLKVDVSAVRNPGYVFSPVGKLSYNGQTLTGPALQYPVGGTYVYNQNAILTEKAPDGTVWTAASLAAASLALTP